MNYHSMSDNALLHELGNRIKLLRLQRNITQEELAETTLLSVGTIKSLEAGKAKLATLVAVLRELDALDQLDAFVPETNISPLDIAHGKPVERVRAGRRKSTHSHTNSSKNNDIE